jgi:hypothetical protein
VLKVQFLLRVMADAPGVATDSQNRSDLQLNKHFWSKVQR